jgi:hypothetical protein
MTETRTPLDKVDELLAGRPHIGDGGFTDRVMASLPTRRPWRQALPLALGGLAAATVAAWVLPGALEAAAQALRAWRPAEAALPAGALGAVAAVGAVVCVWLSLAVEG